MERQVKERLVGAAVLMAAAIILIPEMLSGPDRDEDAATAASSNQRSGEKGATPAPGNGNAPIKTYTIDLSQSPGTSVAANVEENRAPPPEEAPSPAPVTPQSSATDTQANPEAADKPIDSPVDAPAAVSAAPVSETPAARDSASASVIEAPTQAAPAAANPSPRPLASTAPTPTSGWAVQLGSFAKQATAERLMKEVRAQGHQAFVMPVKSGGSTLYRVRVGPMKDRASAEAALRSVKSKVPGAAIVAHP